MFYAKLLLNQSLSIFEIMNAQAEKELPAKWILHLEDESVLHQVKSLKKASEEGTLLSEVQWEEVEKRRADHLQEKTESFNLLKVEARLIAKFDFPSF